MKSTDCIEVPFGIVEYLLGEARFALKNAEEVNANLISEAVEGTASTDWRIVTRAASIVSCNHVQVIVNALQEIVDGAES